MISLSDLLPINHPVFFNSLKTALGENDLSFHLIANTKDIWCRDYMPVRIDGNRMIRFRYDPSYLRKYPEIRIDSSKLIFDPEILILDSHLILDGGNIVQTDEVVILTDTVFKENPRWTKDAITNELQDKFGKRIVFIPTLPEDLFGHADGMLRFINNSKVLVSDFPSVYGKEWINSFHNSLLEQGLEIVKFPYFETGKQNKQGIDSAEGCYINYLQTECHIFLPTFNDPLDNQALAILQDEFPQKKIIQIDAIDIANEGGVLNCISWN